MKTPSIRFFAPEENSLPTKQIAKAKLAPTGYISTSGKIVLPALTLEELGIEAATASFRIGTQEGKRKIKSLYLVPTTEQEGAFSFARSGRGGYVIPLALILKKGGVNFESAKVPFSVTLFNYAGGVTGYELSIEDIYPKPAYTGKPRGRKAKQPVLEAE